MDCCGKKSNYMLVEIVLQSGDTDFGQLLNRVLGIQQTNDDVIQVKTLTNTNTAKSFFWLGVFLFAKIYLILLKPIKISLDTHISLVGSKITSQNMYTQVIIIYFPRFGKKCFRTKF